MEALIELLTAAPNQGKTQAALAEIGDAKAVFFVPSPRNHNVLFQKWPWVPVSDIKGEADMIWLRAHHHVRVVLETTESNRLADFMGDAWVDDGWVFGFDDFPQLFPHYKDTENFAAFLAGIRHRGGSAIITTQRIVGELPPLIRNVTDAIYQVGPLKSEEEARALYKLGGSYKYENFKAFYAAISANPKYKLFEVKKDY